MSSSAHKIKIRKQHLIACRRAHARLEKFYQRWQQLSQKLTEVDEARNQLFSQQNQSFLQQFQAFRLRLEQEDISMLPNEIDTLKRRIERFTQNIQEEIPLLQAALLEEQAEEARKRYHRSKNLAILTELLQDKLPTRHSLNHDTDLQSILFHQLSEQADKEQSHLTEEQSALLSSLLAEQHADSPQAWQAPIAPAPKTGVHSGPMYEQIDTMIIRLGILDNQRDLSPYQSQYQTVLSLKDEVQKQLSADSLVLELATQIRQEQQLQDLRTQLAVAIAELESLEDEEAVTIAREADSIVQKGSLIEISTGLEQVNDAITRIEQRIISAERRHVVLEGLRGLGYQVNENSVNAWLADGQVVISHPSTPDYGLELGAGGEESARFQVRTVAFSEDRDTARDRDVDAIWCHQHHQLQENLAKAGAELTIDRALPPGSGKMKVRERVDAARQQRVVNHNKTRVLKG
ncbi:hypothetical protein [Xenorhabdus szentirmaii]|uniref:hypothetical protein n=1 Tax=Xenorhabdus szentirmaii TaxID=290112 RepID=UPI0019A526D6|nr:MULTISPECIES: hypothetical protein [unclassified Xenorhabdus]MBD2791938.1 hypothetical protein [Xenorhabdus sp. CUL]MBD2823608.1 hypothetical protein [Xenorhabdus sp. 5]